MSNDMNTIKPPMPPNDKSIVTQDQCNELLTWFDSNSRLNHPATEVKDLVNLILKDKNAIEYVSNKNQSFDFEYKNHYIDNIKNFALMDRTCSLIMSVCMRMWH